MDALENGERRLAEQIAPLAASPGE
jgi:hypothetical protein